MPRTATASARRSDCERSAVVCRSPSLRMLLLLVVACLCTCGVAASAAPSSSSSLFVSSSGLLVDSPLSLQGVDVGSALAQMAKQIAAQEARIATLQADLTATTDRLTAVESLSGSSAIVSAVQSVTITTNEIGSLTGDSDIVAAVLALRAAVTTVNQSIVVLESTTNAASTQLAAAINSSTTSLQSELAGVAADFSSEIAELQLWNSTAINAITSLSSSLTSLLSTVADIADLTGTTTIVTTIQSIIDSMSDQATEIATLQTRLTSDEANIAALQSLTAEHSAQIALLANRTATLDSQVALVADSGTYQASGSDLTTGLDVCWLSTRNVWVESTMIKPLNITRNGTYAVYGTGRITRLANVTDWYWVLGLTLTRDGTMSLLTTAIGNPSTVSYVAGTVGLGDASRELHWVGSLQDGDAVKLQYFVRGSVISAPDYKIESNRNGGNRLTALFLRA